jgi:hypothetical protein
MQRKYKFLTLIAVCAFALVMVMAMAAPAIGAWINQSIVNVTTGTATDTFTTTVAGADANAVNTPITLSVGTYSGTYVQNNIGTFTPPSVTGSPNNPSTVDVSANGFVPGEWAALEVTITNTGQAALQFSPGITVTDEFNAPGGSYTFPSPYTEGTVGPHTYADTFDFGSAGFDYGTSVNTFGTAVFLGNYLSAGSTAGCYDTWCTDNVYIGPTETLPTVLTTGQSFSYYLYMGLGLNAPPTIPGSIYSITITLTPAP